MEFDRLESAEQDTHIIIRALYAVAGFLFFLLVFSYGFYACVQALG